MNVNAAFAARPKRELGGEKGKAMSITKYVIVLPSGDWLDMGDNYQQVKAIAAKYPHTHVEQWTWKELPDGSHGTPQKYQV